MEASRQAISMLLAARRQNGSKDIGEDRSRADLNRDRWIQERAMSLGSAGRDQLLLLFFLQAAWVLKSRCAASKYR